MHHRPAQGIVSRTAALSLHRALVLIVSAGAALSYVQAQPAPAITNLAQLTKAFSRHSQRIVGIAMTATVFACDTNSGVLTLQDSSGAELLEMDGLQREFVPGDVVRIQCGSCLLSSSDLGVCISAVPLLNNDGLHSARTISGEFSFKAGRYPLRLDWFNQFSAFELEASCTATNSQEQLSSGPRPASTNLIHAVRAECFQGFWSKLPNFQLLRPVKVATTTNFDIGLRTRDEMEGIRFEGYFEAPRNGQYVFSLRSDDGSRLWIGNPAVPVIKIGRNAPPAPRPAAIGETMAGPDEQRLMTIQGRVSFASRAGIGLRLELRSEQNSISVLVADAGSLAPTELLNGYVRVSGVAKGVLTESGRVVLGRLAVASCAQLAILENPPGKRTLPSVLRTVMQVQSLSRENAARQMPVRIKGVVTAVGGPRDHWMAIEDDTRGAFVSLTSISNYAPEVGEMWSVSGHTQPGDFAPIISAEKATFLGKGLLPRPAHPSWNQLINGSMDVQWVEIEGIVTGVQSNRLSLLLPEGRQEIVMSEWGQSELSAFSKAVVCIRGALFAVWNAQTHEVRSGSIEMRNASISVEKPAPDDPFDAPEKTPRGLFHFDAKATPFQRVKVLGQITYLDAKSVFIQRGSAIQVFPATGVNLRAGDWIEAVGYPEISVDSALLRDALLRKTGDGVLPRPPLVSDSQLTKERLASMRIRVEGKLAGRHTEEGTLVLQIQTHANLFHARLPNAESLRSLRLGSKLSLTGIYVSEAQNALRSSDTSHFELLINAPGDVAVISEPSWWTLQRLLTATGVLGLTLALAAVWIALLRRQVAQRTLQLHHEIRERERAERQHALEAERSRIARDLHDDLGSSLTEINVLASKGQRPRLEDNAQPVLFRAIAEKARSLVAALDVIVWAVDPEDNSLQSLADYLSGYTREYLSSSSISCRFRIPVVFPNATLDGQIRHEVLMVLKETLNNIVRHAEATEVEFQMSVADDTLEICIADNGKGFDPNTDPVGHGLKNRSARLMKIAGNCDVESHAGSGTTVRIRLPIQVAPAAEARS